MTPFLRRLIPYLTVALAAVAIYNAAIFYIRWRNVREDQERQVSRQADDARKTIDALGGDQLKLLNFYVSPGVVKPGESASMCYGVNAAVKLTITPDVGTPVYPAYSRCLQVSPKTTTEYTITAEDKAGKKVTGAAKVTVVR